VEATGGWGAGGGGAVAHPAKKTNSKPHKDGAKRVGAKATGIMLLILAVWHCHN
jgi:hypothetical protein